MYTARRMLKMGDTFRPHEIEYIEKDFLDEWLREHSREDDVKIHHYTSANGIKGIIDEKSIWCSEIEYLNDSQEIDHGFSKIKSKIKEIRSEYNNEAVSYVLDSLRNSLESFPQGTHRVFVACFCEDKDLLSQWRGYAEEGGGYSMGFNFSDYTNIISSYDDPYSPHLRKVIYDTKKQDYYIDKYIRNTIEKVKSIGRVRGEDVENMASWKSFGAHMMNVTMDMIISFKEPSFKEENEWRLVRALRSWDEALKNTNYRNVNGVLIPYIPTQIFEDNNGNKKNNRLFPLYNITCGPTLPERRARLSISSLLKSSDDTNGISIDSSSVSIESAETPYRG